MGYGGIVGGGGLEGQSMEDVWDEKDDRFSMRGRGLDKGKLESVRP